jgi:hypothetical protein
VRPLTGGTASPDTLEVVFASTSPAVLCNFLLEQADSGNEECKKELNRILAAVASRNFCANDPDVHAGSDENQPSNKRPRRKETHARVNSQDLCQKAFMQPHHALMSLISRIDGRTAWRLDQTFQGLHQAKQHCSIAGVSY